MVISFRALRSDNYTTNSFGSDFTAFNELSITKITKFWYYN